MEAIPIQSNIGTIHIIGVGGTGSYIVEGLAKLIAGYNLNINVVLHDGDIVEEKNIYRQNFKMYEIGMNKADALCHRMSMEYGVCFNSSPDNITYLTNFYCDTLVITAVDNMTARKIVAEKASTNHFLWLDTGNEKHTGQVILGGTVSTDKSLPYANQLYPDVYNAPELEVVKRTSCADSPFTEQSIYINELVATTAKKIIMDILVEKAVTVSEAYIDITAMDIIQKGYQANRLEYVAS